jgi:kynurenine formamidase
VKIVDLSRELYHRTPSYPGHPPVMHGMWKTHEEALAESRNVYGLSSMFISMPDHAGTHIDAPRHFGRSGISIDQYPLEKCIVPGICLDLRHIPPRAEIKPSDLKMAVEKAGAPVPKGGTVLLCTGHHERTFPRKEYSTDNPGVNVAATEWLAKQGIVWASIRCARGRTVTSTCWFTRPVSTSTSPTSRACAISKRCSARANLPSSACQ